MKRSLNENKIPLMISKLSKYWEQPSSNNFLIDENYVIMTQEECDQLAEYDTSRPSGVYVGKMWRRVTNRASLLLCWYGAHKDPDLCTINERWILIV